MNKENAGANLHKLPCITHFCEVHKQRTVISPIIGSCTGCGRTWTEEINYQRETGISYEKKT